MDRFSLESAALAGNAAAHYQFWGEFPSDTPEVLECPNCKGDCDELAFVAEYESDMCPKCRAEAMAIIAAELEQVEAVPAVLGSVCCGAAVRGEYRDFGVCPETGHHDCGDVTVCTACGNEAEVEMVPALPERKPVASATAEGIQSEVA